LNIFNRSVVEIMLDRIPIYRVANVFDILQHGVPVHHYVHVVDAKFDWIRPVKECLAQKNGSLLGVFSGDFPVLDILLLIHSFLFISLAFLRTLPTKWTTKCPIELVADRTPHFNTYNPNKAEI